MARVTEWAERTEYGVRVAGPTEEPRVFVYSTLGACEDYMTRIASMIPQVKTELLVRTVKFPVVPDAEYGEWEVLANESTEDVSDGDGGDR